MVDSASQRRTDFISQIMEFRTAYLKAVARATVDLDFRQRITKTGSYAKEKEDIATLDILKSEVNYQCPWDMTLKLLDSSDNGPRVNAANGTVMTRPYRGEIITIYIPNRPDLSHYPEKERPAVLMAALAAYYHENQYFLSTKLDPAEGAPAASSAGARATGSRPAEQHTTPDGDDPPFVRVETFRLMALRGETPPDWSSVDANRGPTPRFNLGTCLDDFTSFAAAMFNAVAMSWENEQFRNLLITLDDRRDKKHEPKPPKHTITILDQWLGYHCPWEFELVVKPDNQAEYDARHHKWIKRTPPELTLTLPWMTGALTAKDETEKNANHTGVAIMGLALYNTDGPGYPFTCG